MAEQSKIVPPVFGSYAEWAQSRHAPAIFSEPHSLGTGGASLMRFRLTESFHDPVSPDISLQMLTAGVHDIHAAHGFGRFKGDMRQGDFLVTPPNQPAEAEGSGKSEGLVLSLPWSTIQAQAEQSLQKPVPHLERVHVGINRDATIESLLHALWREKQSGDLLGTLFADGVLTALTARLLHLSENPLPAIADSGRGLSKTDLKRVLDYIQDNLAGTIAIDTLAAQAGYSIFHFSRLFKQSTGLAPHQYVIAQRIERAAKLLQGSSRTISEISVATGFTHESHLARHMRRLLGVSPRQMRTT